MQEISLPSYAYSRLKGEHDKYLMKIATAPQLEELYHTLVLEQSLFAEQRSKHGYRVSFEVPAEKISIIRQLKNNAFARPYADTLHNPQFIQGLIGRVNSIYQSYQVTSKFEITSHYRLL